jgi:hypothetical protein
MNHELALYIEDVRCKGVEDGNGYPKPEYPTGFTR